VAQVAGEDPRDILPFRGWMSQETPLGYLRATGHHHHPLSLGFRGNRIGEFYASDALSVLKYHPRDHSVGHPYGKRPPPTPNTFGFCGD